MRATFVMVLCLAAGIVGLLAQSRSGTLNIYYIDTEGGQSTLFVGPTGESLLGIPGTPAIAILAVLWTR